MAADLAYQVASRVRDAGQWLDGRKPGQVVGEMESFARRRPTAFLVLAAGAGVVAGRLTRGLKDVSSGDPAAGAAAAGAAAPVVTQELSGQWAQPSDVAGYPPATARPGEEIPGLSAPASRLPPTGGDPAWEADQAHGERHPLVTDDQAGRKGTL